MLILLPSGQQSLFSNIRFSQVDNIFFYIYSRDFSNLDPKDFNDVYFPVIFIVNGKMCPFREVK